MDAGFLVIGMLVLGAVLGAGLIAAVFHRGNTEAPVDSTKCSRCRYSLVGLEPNEACPECGASRELMRAIACRRLSRGQMEVFVALAGAGVSVAPMVVRAPEAMVFSP